LRPNLLLTGLALAILAHSAQAQQPKKDDRIKNAAGEAEPRVHQMVILNGGTRSVHYFAVGGSPSEQSALDSLGRAENKVAMEDSLQALKRQYISTEQALEARRRQQQLALYGVSFETNSKRKTEIQDNFVNVDTPLVGGSFGSPFFPGNGGFSGLTSANPGVRPPGFVGTATAASGFPSFGLLGTGLGPRSFGAGNGTGFGNSGFLGNGFFGGGFAGGAPYNFPGPGVPSSGQETFSLATDSKFTQSLANGIGDEGAFKRAMVAAIAKDGSGDSSSSAAAREYDRAVANAAPLLRKSNIVGVDYQKKQSRRAIVTMKDKEKLTGVLVSEDPEWVVIQTDDSEIKVRTADVARITMERQK